AVPPPAEPPKPVDTTKPESKVLEPAPSPAVIPPAAPAQEPAKDAAKDAKKEGEKAVKDKQAAEAAKAETAKGEAAKASAPPATLVFAVQPWGEIYVNGKSRGVTPPMKSLKLEPGKYKIEVRNTTFPVHTENLELKARDEVTVRYKFQ
ncbi:MAG TPA: PEGA domain-containing protein, partial [Usitatibacter sp.]|nr:PEGA domain-containing protein [Usitatibacter sp.]